MKRELHIVDVFTDQRYTGNPLAVVLSDGALPEKEMHPIAVEMNYSETTFVCRSPQPDGRYAVRMFTPSHEVAFAGHPILGTAWVLREALGLDRGAPVVLQLRIGPVTVTFERSGGGEAAWFRAPPAEFGATCEPEAMAEALGLSPLDIDDRWPVQAMARGTGAMIVPLRTLDALRRARLDLATYAPLRKRGFPPNTYLFCRETRDRANNLSARFFFETNGVREDPATGNGAAFLGYYLLNHVPGADHDLRIAQGHELGRPSHILVRARREGAASIVEVGGSVVASARGELV